MKYKVTWQPPILPDIEYNLHIESGAVSVGLMLTVPEVIAAFKAIRDDEEYQSHWSRPWWVAVEHERPVFTIEAIDGPITACASLPGEQVHGALEEILEHASQQG